MRKRRKTGPATAFLLIGLAGLVLFGSLTSACAPKPAAQAPSTTPAVTPSQPSTSGPGAALRAKFPPAPRPATFTSNAERIYFTSVDEQGLRAVPSLAVAKTLDLSCADCHGVDRKGGKLMPDGKTKSADLTSKGLKDLTAAQVKVEITKALDEKGEKLSSWMPSWSMPANDLNQLVDYLKKT